MNDALHNAIETKFVLNREGAALRTAEELTQVFIDDACALLDVNPQPLTNSPCIFDCDEDVECEHPRDRSDDAREYEEKLNAAGYSVVWDDGYVIYKDLTDEEAEYLNG